MPANAQAQRNRDPRASAPPVPIIPFTAAAHEHTEPIFDQTVTPGTSVQQLSTIDVPAYGFLRNIVLEVSGSGGALGGGALSADYPFNIFSSITLSDVNGAPIFGPLDGYAVLWSNIVGAYAGRPDPRTLPAYDGTINTVFFLRIPIEVSHHDGFGSLANQNAAASYKLNIAINTLANIITGGAPTAPAVRIRGYLEAWSLPNEVDVAGRPQAQFPPLHGTTQFWSQNVKAVSVGNNTIPLVRVGNLIRSIVVIARNAAGARTAAVFPDPAQLNWDARSILLDTQRYRNAVAYERTVVPSAWDTGVFVYHFNHSNHNLAGDDSPTFWLPTVQASRLEIAGTVGTAGNLQILTNDVAPAEVIPAERFVETSDTGFRPDIGVSNATGR